MALGTFTLRIDGSRLGGDTETTAELKLRIQGQAAIKDSAAHKFLFPHNANRGGVTIGLPFSIDLPTDVTTGKSTQIGYTVELSTEYGGKVSSSFAARASGSTVDLTDLVETIVVPVSDSQAFRDQAQAAAGQAESAKTAAQTAKTGAETARTAAEAAAAAATAPTATMMATVAKDQNSEFAKFQLATFAKVFTPEAQGAAATYSASTDDTPFVQAAINACIAAGGGKVYLARRYRIAGAVQTGSVLSGAYNYAGQILLPARSMTQRRISVTIEGPASAPQTVWQVQAEPAVDSGGILESTATSGNVIDAIAGSLGIASAPITNIHLVLRNLSVVVPNDPQCGGVNAQALASFGADGVLVTVNAAGNAIAVPTGTTQVGLWAPLHDNAAWVRVRDTNVNGFPVGIEYGEHTVLDNLCVQKCKIGVRPKHSSGHYSQWVRVLAQQCLTVVDVPTTAFYGGSIEGVLDAESSSDPSWATSTFINDPGNKLSGKLSIICTTAPTKGLPINGALSLNVANLARGSAGWFETLPQDTFTRVKDIAASLGSSDMSCHPWVVLQGTWTTQSSGRAVSSGGTYNMAYARYVLRGSGSRTVTGIFTTAASGYQIGLMLNRVYGGAGASNYLRVVLNGGQVKIVKRVGSTDTTLAQSAAGLVAGSTTYTLKVAYTNGADGAITLAAYLNGSPVVSYTLDPATEVPIFTDAYPTTTPPGQKADGIFAYGDSNSYCSYFGIASGV